MSVRMTVNINDETAYALKALASKRGSTVTEIVRRSVTAYKFLCDAQDAGDEIRLVDTCGCQSRLDIP